MRLRLCLLLASLLLSAVPGAEDGLLILQEPNFADWKTAALDSCEVMQDAEVVFGMMLS